MMDENRVTHRFRPRPYDLRRKVLLKNFLREQMTYIPPLRGTSETTVVDDNSNFSEDPDSTSIGNEENFESLENDHENTQPIIPVPDETPSSSISADEQNEESISDDSVASKDAEIPPSKFSLVSSLLKLKGSRKKRKKGITKAKHVYKCVKSPSKSISVKPTREKRSFFSLFKSRREKRNKAVNIKNVPSDTQSAVPVSVSVQTDISWSNTEYNELQQSHKNLQEENRLLSESLSFIMSDMDFKTRSEKQPSVCTDTYEPKTSETQTAIDTSLLNKEPVAQKSKLLRSKSVQDKSSTFKIRLRSRSMNFPETSKPTNIFPPAHSSGRDSYVNRSRFLPESNLYQHQNSRPSVLKNLPINPGRIVRRSSMPERVTREPVRPLLRQRSNSIRAHYQSFDSYRNSSYQPYPSRRQCSLKSLPTNNVGKPVVRRSSMPERMPPSYFKAVQRCRSVNNRDYVTNKYSSRVRYPGDCSRSVPFHNLPNEAFY